MFCSDFPILLRAEIFIVRVIHFKQYLVVLTEDFSNLEKRINIYQSTPQNTKTRKVTMHAYQTRQEFI